MDNFEKPASNKPAIAMKTNLILIGIGGGIGSMLRYLTSLYISRHFSSYFPLGTFAVNIIGCLIIGIAYGLSLRFPLTSPSVRLFLTTGFCGGFTTFSTFAYENVQLLEQSNYSGFALYAASSFVLCIAAVFAGAVLIRLI